ncbi:MAG: SurA N-terminal domain-containing protein [Paracoccaceae bacterium]
MLDFFRRGVKSIFAQILLALLILSFAVWGIGDVFTGGRTTTIANVGDTEVNSEQFVNALTRQQSILSQQAGELVNFEDIRAAGVDQGILTALVREATYAEELSTMGIAVPADAIRDTIASNPSFLDAEGNFNQLAYQGVIGQQGYSPRSFEALTARLLGEQILADSVTTGVVTPDALAKTIAKFDGERRSASVLRLTLIDAPDPGTPDDATLTAWFDENKDQFQAPERRWGNYLRIDPAELAEGLAPSEDELRAAYEANQASYTVEATRTVEQIVFQDPAAAEAAMTRLTDGSASFAEIAAEQNLSLDDIALGTVRQDDLAGPTADAAFAASEPGFAGPIEGLFGTVILNVTAVQAGGQQPFEVVRDGISYAIARERARSVVNEKVNQLDDIRAGGAELPELAEQTGLVLRSFGGLDRRGGVTEGAAPEVAGDVRFTGEVFDATIDEERDIVELQDGSFVLIMLDRIAETALPPLEEIKPDVTAVWQDVQRVEALEAQATQLVLEHGGDLDVIAGVLGKQTDAVGAFARSAPPPGFAPELIGAMFSADEGDAVVGRSSDGRSAVIAKITGLEALEGADLDIEAQEVGDIFSNSLARDQLEYFARALEARHGAQVSVSAVDGVFEQLNQIGYGAGSGGM